MSDLVPKFALPVDTRLVNPFVTLPGDPVDLTEYLREKAAEEGVTDQVIADEQYLREKAKTYPRPLNPPKKKRQRQAA